MLNSSMPACGSARHPGEIVKGVHFDATCFGGLDLSFQMVCQRREKSLTVLSANGSCTAMLYSDVTETSPEPETLIFRTLYPGKDSSLPLTDTLSPTTSIV